MKIWTPSFSLSRYKKVSSKRYAGYKYRLWPKPGNEFYKAVAASSNESLAEIIVLSAIHYTAARAGADVKVTALSSAAQEFLSKYAIPKWIRPEEPGTSVFRKMMYLNCGPGHVIQRLQTMLQLPRSILPQGELMLGTKVNKGRVAIHLAI